MCHQGFSFCPPTNAINTKKFLRKWVFLIFHRRMEWNVLVDKKGHYSFLGNLLGYLHVSRCLSVPVIWLNTHFPNLPDLKILSMYYPCQSWMEWLFTLLITLTWEIMAARESSKTE